MQENSIASGLRAAFCASDLTIARGRFTSFACTFSFDRSEHIRCDALAFDRIVRNDVGGAPARPKLLDRSRDVVGLNLAKRKVLVGLAALSPELTIGESEPLPTDEARHIEHVGNVVRVIPLVERAFLTLDRVR